MSGTGSMSPFIKDEPEDHHYLGNKMFINGQLGMSTPYNNQSGFTQAGGINPNLTLGSVQNGGFGNFNNSSSSYQKSAVFGDDELIDSFGDTSQDHHNNQGQHGDYNNLGGMGFDMNTDLGGGHNGMGSMTIDHSHIGNGFSSTPDGNPMASPFARSFTAEQFRQSIMQQQYGATPISYGGSPHLGSDMYSAGMEDPYNNMNAKPQSRPRLPNRDQRSSHTRSPMTPKTPSLNVGDLNLNTVQPSSYPSQPIRTNTSQSHRHQKLPSQDWGDTPASMASPLSSVFASPLQHSLHPNPQISSILSTGQHASLPAKVSNGHHSSSNGPALQSQEMKRRRRRESHNLVERRRRDNINERIQELSHLVPLHRLEDEKVKKHLQNNSPLSPTLGSVGVSPPQATSGLAGPGARRATAGNITTGIPIEEKDKGPNKGDILNGAVSWTRDLMWYTNVLVQKHAELKSMYESSGNEYPFAITEDEARMQTELMDAIAKNGVSNFSYSRTPGSGLRVPRHTNIKGDTLEMSNNGAAMNDNSLSPEDHDTGGDAVQGGLGMGGAGQYWSGHNSGESGPGSIGFKEEDEYGGGMDLV